MPTLNRFPLLGLWAREAARRLGYTRDEAEALGHAYAVLYAIRAQGTGRKPHKEKKKAKKAAAAEGPPVEELDFCGDQLDVIYDDEGHVQGKVGGEAPQTARTYRAHIARKFPAGYYEKLEEAFRAVMKSHAPREFRSRRLLYDLYDQWKKSCGVGRLVDLDKLLAWCEKHRADDS